MQLGYSDLGQMEAGVTGIKRSNITLDSRYSDLGQMAAGVTRCFKFRILDFEVAVTSISAGRSQRFSAVVTKANAPGGSDASGAV